jgi:multidrug resistance efflux pump
MLHAPAARHARAEAVGAVTLGRLFVFGGAALLFGVFCTNWLGRHAVEVVPATLQTKTLSVAAARPAQLAELFVQSGQAVQPQAPLFRLADDRLQTRIATKRREIVELAAELKRVEATADVDWEWRRRELQREAFETELKAAEYLQARVQHQVEHIAWTEQWQAADDWLGDDAGDRAVQLIAFTNETPSPARLQALLRADAAAGSVETNDAQLALCERKLTELAELEARLTDKVRISVGVDVARTRFQQAEDELQILEEQAAALTIHSPGYGTVAGLSSQVGDALLAGQSVVELLDDDQRFVMAHVPSASVERFHSGQTVVVRFGTQHRLQGRIAEIPPQASPSAEAQDATIPVRIAPCGKLWPKLPIGSRATVELPPGR